MNIQKGIASFTNFKGKGLNMLNIYTNKNSFMKQYFMKQNSFFMKQYF